MGNTNTAKLHGIALYWGRGQGGDCHNSKTMDSNREMFTKLFQQHLL